MSPKTKRLAARKADSGKRTALRFLLWDFDGTLGYRAGGMWSASLLEVLQREEPGMDVSIDQLRPFMQRGLPWNNPETLHPHLSDPDDWWGAVQPLFAEAYRGVGVAPLRAEELAGCFRAVYTDLDRWRLFDDTLPVLRGLSAQGWRHAVLSNHVPELRNIIEHLGLNASIERLFNSAETGCEKPHPRAFQTALDALGPLEQVWMIGDNFTADILGAQAAGVPGILVREPNPLAQRFAWNLEEAAALIQTL